MRYISNFILCCVLLQITRASIIGHADYTFRSIQALRDSNTDENSYEQYTLGQVEEGKFSVSHLEYSNFYSFTYFQAHK